MLWLLQTRIQIFPLTLAIIGSLGFQYFSLCPTFQVLTLKLKGKEFDLLFSELSLVAFKTARFIQNIYMCTMDTKGSIERSYLLWKSFISISNIIMLFQHYYLIQKPFSFFPFYIYLAISWCFKLSIPHLHPLRRMLCGSLPYFASVPSHHSGQLNSPTLNSWVLICWRLIVQQSHTGHFQHWLLKVIQNDSAFEAFNS
jgi:hypothetical protein